MFLEFRKNTLKILPFLLILYFIGMRGFLLVHEFSHHLNFPIDQKVDVDSKQQNQYSKTSNKNNNSKKEDDDFCWLCHLENFYQHNVLLASLLAWCLAMFFANRLFSFNDKIKLSYLLSSYHTRAPPAVL